MIKVGTLCLLLLPHQRAGQFCTVIGDLEFIAENRTGPEAWAHEIELASGEDAGLEEGEPGIGWGWMATPWELLPIAPPGLTERTDKRDKAPA